MNKHGVIGREAKNYPLLLKQIYKPPEILYFKGDIDLLEKNCLAVVGTRNMSEYGEFVTREIIEQLALYDIVIVSGLAKGIDSVAHRAALDFDLPTIAVLGSGIDNIYPKQNINLADQIIKKGLLISEFKGDLPPTKFSFPQRNRIISALSLGVLVVECAKSSGALITARFALEQNREVFTVPGDIDRENSLGPLGLLKGSMAHPVSSANDIMEILRQQPKLPEIDSQKEKFLLEKRKSLKSMEAYKLSGEEKAVLESIPKRVYASLDRVCMKTSFSPNRVLAILSILEIQDFIRIRNGKYLRNC